MTMHPAVPDVVFPLRSEAQTRLRDGTAPTAGVATTDFAALAVLQDMAIAPGGASGALKLLHELQVHQVELDLQHEQMEQCRDELTQARDDYRERFELAPMPYCVVARDGRLVECNRAAADWFGREPSALDGVPLAHVVGPQGRFACLAMLKRLCAGSARETFEVRAQDGMDPPRRYRLVATTSAGGRSFLVMLIDVDRS